MEVLPLEGIIFRSVEIGVAKFSTKELRRDHKVVDFCPCMIYGCPIYVGILVEKEGVLLYSDLLCNFDESETMWDEENLKSEQLH
jgi:hypothetical protein